MRDSETAIVWARVVDRGASEKPDAPPKVLRADWMFKATESAIMLSSKWAWRVPPYGSRVDVTVGFRAVMVILQIKFSTNKKAVDTMPTACGDNRRCEK